VADWVMGKRWMKRLLIFAFGETLFQLSWILSMQKSTGMSERDSSRAIQFR
jgi:hypothetical protein